MDTCPNCGYCKHCGRGAQPPYWHGPIWIAPIQPWAGAQPQITWTYSGTTTGAAQPLTNYTVTSVNS